MSDKYKTHSTSNVSAKVDDKVLSITKNTRKIIRPEIIENPHDPEASVKITILHQKAVSRSQFEDIHDVPLTKLKAKEIAKLNLNSAETKVLSKELEKLYFISREGVPRGERSLVVANEDEVILTDPKRAGLIKQLVGRGYSEEVWTQLVETDPDLATKLSHARLHQARSSDLKIFSEMLGKKYSEADWQNFFERNTWIFGYGLDYRIQRTVAPQPHYGGTTFEGRGGNRGDFLQATLGNARFTVLVEIKTPSTNLLATEPFRNDAYIPSDELAGGVAQLRANARTWEVEGSTSSKNSEKLLKGKIFTIKPKKMLVVGNTKEILEDIAKRTSFELFRRNQSDVEILTFDEVFERAKFIVEHDNWANTNRHKDP